MLFDKIIGHDRVKEQLLHTIATGRISHAQLFVGGEGVGALPLAIAYAQAVMCRRGTGCGECSECYKMERLEHPDCHFVFPVNKSKKARSTGHGDDKPTSDQFIHLWREFITSHAGYVGEQQWYEYIGIDNAQGNINREEANELMRKMSFKSFEGGYKVVVVWLPERMQEGAANALLKLIEEPAPRTLFLFVSESPDKIIPTIRSRMQTVSLADVPSETIARELVLRGACSEVDAMQIAHAASGSWSRALELCDQDGNADEYLDMFIDLMRRSYNGRYVELFDWAEQIALIGREGQKRFCQSALGVLRECYLSGLGMDHLAMSKPQSRTFVANFAPFVNHLTIEAFVAEFELLLRQIRQNGNPKILFPHFALSISKILNVARNARK